MPTQNDIKVFANTLFKLGVKQNKLTEYKESFSDLNDVFDRDDNLKRFLVSPRINRNDKKAFLGKIFGDKFSKDFLGFVNVVLAKRCQSVLKKIFKHFQDLVDKHENIARAKAVSAHKLDQQTQDKIAEVLSKRFGKKIILTSIVNEKILGGLILQVGDTRVDMSILHSLDNLKDKIQNIKTGGAIL